MKSNFKGVGDEKLECVTFKMSIKHPRAVGYVNLEIRGGIRLEIQVWEPSGYR